MNNNSDESDGNESDVPNFKQSGNMNSRRIFSKRKILQFRDSDSSSESNDSDSSDAILVHHRKTVCSISDGESSSDSSTVSKLKRNTGVNIDAERFTDDISSISKLEGNFSENEAEIISDQKQLESDSDSQSEKCPICLLAFMNQELGTPESCDHLFCLECIQEWSKNMNTCPVDRQEYNLIFVRKGTNLEIERKISVEKPVSQNDVNIVEDSTYCEICGSGENEDRLLLCDGCDLGFHLECLTPALDEVPRGSWYCTACSRHQLSSSGLNDPSDNNNENAADTTHDNDEWRYSSNRLVPRTRQSERVRQQIASIRSRRRIQPSTSFPIRSSQNSNFHIPKRAQKKNKRTLQKNRNKKSFHIVYELNNLTGEAVPVKTKSTQCKSSKYALKAGSVKKQFGRNSKKCFSNIGNYAIKPINKKAANTSLESMRSQAGITSLNLFGDQYQFNYFSDDEVNDSHTGTQVLIRRQANNETDIIRRVMRKKSLVPPTNIVSSTTDLLGGILETQTKFFSKRTTFSVVPSTGDIKMRENRKIFNTNNNYLDLNQLCTVRQRPGGGNSNQNYRNSYSTTSREYNQTNRTSAYVAPTSTTESTSTTSNRYYPTDPTNEIIDIPQDYTQRTLCEAQMVQDQENKEETDDSDIDVYSDMEAKTKNEYFDNKLEPPPSPPPLLSQALEEDDYHDNNSESSMVIDTDKAQDEMLVTSTVESNNFEQIPGALFTPFSDGKFQSDEHSSEHTTVAKYKDDMQKDVDSQSQVLVTMQTDIDQPPGNENSHQFGNENENLSVSPDSYDPENPFQDEEKGTIDNSRNDDEGSNDGCPNFNIYSKESKTVALTTDVTILPQLRETQHEINTSFESDLLTSPERNPSPPVNKYNSNEFDETGEIKQKTSPKRNPSPPIDNEQSNTTMLPTNPPCSSIQVDRPLDHSKFKIVVKKNKASPKTSLFKPLHSKSFKVPNTTVSGSGLYSDSEDESVVKKKSGVFGISDNVTEEIISEEERSYTPCLDEQRDKGIQGLDTEMISDEEKNDFDESHERRTVSDGDALEINVNQLELDLQRPDDYEEGEIIDKGKEKNEKPKTVEKSSPSLTIEYEKKNKDKDKSKEKYDKEKKKKKEKSRDDKVSNKENHDKTTSFKKISKNNKERNYRDKEKVRNSETPPLQKGQESRDSRKKKEKRKEIERYNVRALIADKPRPSPKDKFGRDIRKTLSKSRSRSYTPPIAHRLLSPRLAEVQRQRSVSRPRRSLSRRRLSSPRGYRSPSKTKKKSGKIKSKIGSPWRGRSRSKTKKRKRSRSRLDRHKRLKDNNKTKKRATSLNRERSPSLRRHVKEWTPSLSRSSTPNHLMSPSWTPPRVPQTVQAIRDPQLHIIMNPDIQKKRKEKRKKADKKKEGSAKKKRKERERDRTPPPSKEVFASGDNILVSVSFNNEIERDIASKEREKKRKDINPDEIRKKREKRKQQRQRLRELTEVKPVAIIDLERSPFQEIPSSPKDVIILTDSDTNDQGNVHVQSNLCDSSQEVASPERESLKESTHDRIERVSFTTGPKTPPEPQIKFPLVSKTPQLRAIINPLHEPDEVEDPQNEIEEERNTTYKGPNTPPEPPNSPPSSPDVYDPFEPTKSRSPTPQREIDSHNIGDENHEDTVDTRTEDKTDISDEIKKSAPEITDLLPGDSQNTLQVTPEESEQTIGVVINQVLQPVLNTNKPIAQPTPFSSGPSLITSTPTLSNLAPPKINILNSTVIAPQTSTVIPQRIVLPNQVKSSPVKILPTKALLKLTPIKPIQSKNNIEKHKKYAQNGSNVENVILDLDSPYSPGSSDYEDLFEPPSEIVTKPNKKIIKSPQKHQSVFDTLFGSPVYNKKKDKTKKLSPTKTKHVGVKIDEDNLRILDEVPNSAVEMQIKDKFLKKLNRQERVVEEVKLVLKPYYNKKKISKDEYKDIMRRAVPKICHNKTGEINPTKIKNLVEAYVRKVKHAKKVTSSSSASVPQKI